MIFELVRGAGWEPDFPAAEAIYVGLATDTGFFRFNSTNAHAHQVAAEVLRLGVQPAHAFQQIYERNSAAYTRLLGHALTGLTVSAGGAVASVELDRELIRSLQAEEIDSGEITTALLAMDGVRVAVLFRELSDGKIKVSLRSKGDLDVHRLATEFGGGGHRNASGIVSAGPMSRVVSEVKGRAAALLGRR
jgi:phosphoesterase RecJ-like protein